MPCFVALIALAMPRLAIVLVWLLSRGWFTGIKPLWAILGFIFLPTTLLWYSAVQHWWNGQWTLWPVVGIVLALMIDLSPARGRRRRKPD